MKDVKPNYAFIIYNRYSNKKIVKPTALYNSPAFSAFLVCEFFFF